MPTDLTVILKDEPGQLAALGEATGREGVNIRGMAGFRDEDRSVIHLLFDDEVAAARARDAFEDAGLGVAEEREVLVIDIEDRPGALGGLARALGEANVNIELAYTIFGEIRGGGRAIDPFLGFDRPLRRGLVVATDDMDATRAALD